MSFSFSNKDLQSIILVLFKLFFDPLKALFKTTLDRTQHIVQIKVEL